MFWIRMSCTTLTLFVCINIFVMWYFLCLVSCGQCARMAGVAVWLTETARSPQITSAMGSSMSQRSEFSWPLIGWLGVEMSLWGKVGDRPIGSSDSPPATLIATCVSRAPAHGPVLPRRIKSSNSPTSQIYRRWVHALFCFFFFGLLIICICVPHISSFLQYKVLSVLPGSGMGISIATPSTQKVGWAALRTQLVEKPEPAMLSKEICFFWDWWMISSSNTPLSWQNEACLLNLSLSLSLPAPGVWSHGSQRRSLWSNLHTVHENHHCQQPWNLGATAVVCLNTWHVFCTISVQENGWCIWARAGHTPLFG